ncbi:MAG: leucine-rich repeat protein [Corallococcus sp.]|nr:leucine-rich repeat protein [Corallococcus sp.]
MRKSNKLLWIILLAAVFALSLTTLAACNITTPKLNVTVSNNIDISASDSIDTVKQFLTVKYIDSNGETATVTDYELEGTLTEGEVTLTVKYNGISTTCKITVKADTQQGGDDPVTPKLNVTVSNNIDISASDSIDTVKQFLTVKYTDNNAETTTVTDYELEGTLTEGEVTITVKYNGISTTCKITVKADTQQGGDDPVTPKLNVTVSNNTNIFESDSIDTVKQYLTVKYTDSNGVTATVTDYELEGTLTEGEVTLTVKYNGISATCKITVKADIVTKPTVTVNTNGGTFTGSITVNDDGSITEPQTIPTKDNNKFDGWYKDEECTVEWDFDTDKVTEDTTIYVKWIRIYTVTFNTDGGSNITSIQADDNTTIAKPTDPTKEGYEFEGWYKDEDCTVIWNFTTDKVTKNTTIYVKWTEILQGTEGLTYTLNSDGNSYSVTGIGTATETDLVISNIHNTKPVTEIASDAFKNCTNLTSVTIPDSVTSIGNYAFSGCSSLTSVTIPNSATSIGEYAFYACSNLQYNEYDNALYLGNSDNPYFALIKAKNTSITTCSVNENTKTIASSAFSSCSKLTGVTIPDSVQTVASYAFSSCSKLAKVNYTGTIADWCNISFGYYSANPLYYAHNLYINDELVTELVIPNTVTEIKDYTFYGCTSITSAIIPDSITSIGKNAFFGCSNLQYNEYVNALYLGNNDNPYLSLIKAKDTSITTCSVNENTKIIYHSAFSSCSKLTSVTIGSSVQSIGGNAFYKCSKLTKVNYTGTIADWCNISFGNYDANPLSYAHNLYINDKCVTDGELTIPNTVTEIKPYAFYGCTSITRVTIPGNVTAIGDYAFYDCSKLTSVTIPASVQTIGEGAFGCSKLTSIVIPDSVTSIDSYAFSGCSNLTSITIPDSVQTIGEGAFKGCDNIEQATIPALAISSIPKTNLKTVVITSGTEIGGNAFSGCSNLTSITIPDIVQTIGDSAFFGCSNLQYNEYDNALYLGNSDNPYFALIKAKNTYITTCSVNENTKIIYHSAFSNCSNLTTVTIGTSVQTIGRYAFSVCSNLTTVTIGTSVQTIGYAAFSSCSKLTSVTIGSSVQSIGGNAFYKCSKLTKVNYTGTIADWCNISFGNYDANPLSYAHNLYINDKCVTDGELTIPNTVTEIKPYAFYGCTSITSVTIPDSVTSIGSAAFYSCSNLTTVTIGNSVQTIGSYAFYGCALTSVTIPDSVQTIGEYAFSYCRSITSVTIPDSVQSIGESAFWYCSGLKKVYYEGASDDWGKITVGPDNMSLTSATRYYYSESEPTEEGNFWHYDTDGVTVVEW